MPFSVSFKANAFYFPIYTEAKVHFGGLLGYLKERNKRCIGFWMRNTPALQCKSLEYIPAWI